MQLSTVTFQREDTGETFTFGPHPPYMLHPNTKLPTPGALSVSGVENFGADGGMTLASRLQRQPVKIVYNVLENYKHERGMIGLIADGTRFFQAHNDDLSVVRYSMIVQTSDWLEEAYMMKHGSITVPFSAPLVRGYGLSLTNEMDFIFDDPARYWVSGEGVVSGKLTVSVPADLIGERWTSGVQTWIDGLSQWDNPPSDGIVDKQTLNVLSPISVGAEFYVHGPIQNVRITNLTDHSYWQWDGTIYQGFTIHVQSDGTARDWDNNQIYDTLGHLTAQPGPNTFIMTGIAADGSYADLTIRGVF